MATLGQDLVKLKALKQDASAKTKVAKAATDKMKEWERRCFERMDAEETDGHRTHGSLYTPVSKEYAQIQDFGAFKDWCETTGEDLIQDTTRDKELNALVRRLLDDGHPLPPGVGFYTRDYISVRQG